jgi:hypothetical protein
MRGRGTLGLLAFSLAIFSIAACDQTQDTPKASPPAPIENKAPTSIDLSLIEPFDLKLQRSKAFRMDGDLRPIWIVSGRIRNRSDVEIKSISLSFDISTKSAYALVDTANITIDTDIEPHSVASFSREVQVLPPDSEWTWYWHVTKAVPK